MRAKLSIFCLVTALFAAGAAAGDDSGQDVDLCTCMEYWYVTHVGPPPASLRERMQIWTLEQPADGSGIRVGVWNVPGHERPSISELRALWPEASAWLRECRRAQTANPAQWQNEELQVAFVMLIREINALRRQATLPEKDWSEVMELLRGIDVELHE